MMRKALAMSLITALSFATVACATGTGPVPDLNSVADYPAAQEGQSRHVIWLAQQQNEELLKVEIVPGKQMLTDCNTRSLMGSFTAQDLAGWGYTYYQLDNVEGPISTLMACPDDSKIEAFVPVYGDNFTLRYNSKLPIVVYAPNDVEVRYRVWTGSKTLTPAVKQ